MVNSNSFYKTKIEQQNEEFGKLFKTVESLVENTNSKQNNF